MSKLIELRQKKAEAVAKMRGILDKAETEGRDLTETEETEYRTLETSLGDFDAKIGREEKLADEESRLSQVANPLHRSATPRIEIIQEHDAEFRNIGEFLATVASNPFDKRLQELRVQQMGVGTAGGFAIPEQFRETLLQVDPQAALIRPRATVIPAGDPPDAAITIPALDQGASQNVYGGVTIYHQGESDSITESNIRLKQIRLEPKKMTGYTTASNELLRNWTASGALLQAQLRKAIIGAEDTDFFSGDGVNKAKGILNAPCAVAYSRATANQISYADVLGMFARMKFGGSLMWIASQTTIPQLGNIRDAGSNNLFIQSAVPGIPGSLFGYPIVFFDRAPALGTKGDLCLVDLSYYLIKDGSGPFVSMSEHIRFQNDETAFRITWYTDGQSWMNEAIPLEGSTGNTVSPFVILDTP